MNECLNLTLIESRSISPRFDVCRHQDSEPHPGKAYNLVFFQRRRR